MTKPPAPRLRTAPSTEQGVVSFQPYYPSEQAIARLLSNQSRDVVLEEATFPVKSIYSVGDLRDLRSQAEKMTTVDAVELLWHLEQHHRVAIDWFPIPILGMILSSPQWEGKGDNILRAVIVLLRSGFLVIKSDGSGNQIQADTSTNDCRGQT